MAISKLILNGEVQMDVTSDTVEANKLLSGETATKNDGTKVTGTYVVQNPVITSLSVIPTESAQTFNEASISGYKPVIVGAIASDYIGSAVPLISQPTSKTISIGDGVISNFARIHANVVLPFGYLSTATGFTFTKDIAAVQSNTVTPNETVQLAVATSKYTLGSIYVGAISSEYVGSAVPKKSSTDLTANGSTVTAPAGYYSTAAIKNVSSMSAGWQTQFDFKSSLGRLDVSLRANGSGYISSGIHVSTNYNLATLPAQTYTPGPTSQVISSYKWLTGSQTIEAIPSSYIIPTGTSSITSNGVYDIGDYKSVDVNVVGGGDTTIEDAVIGGIPAAVSIYSNDRISSIRHYTCQYINASVFDVPNVSYIGPYAFSGNSYVNTVLTSKLSNVSAYAFNRCTNLENIDLSPVIYLSDYAFESTKLSSSLTLSYLVSTSTDAFANCDSLPSVALPYYDRPIGYGTFYHCSVLSEFYAPFATAIYSSAFNQCSSLKKCNIITAWTISSYAFAGCRDLSSIAFGASKAPVTINQYAFSGCQKLHDVYICNRLSGSGTIQSYAFSGCTSLSNLYILSPSYVSLTNSTAFRNTPISYAATGYGSIYVPDTLYDSYISGANWSYFSDRFVSLTSSEVDAIFDSLSEVNLWFYQEADPADYISPRQFFNSGYKSLNQLIGEQVEYKLLLNNNPGGQTASYLYSMAIFSQILLQSYTTFTAVRPSLSLNFSLCVDLENNTVSYNFNSGKIYGFSFWLRCL